MDELVKVKIRALVPIAVTGATAVSASCSLKEGQTFDIERTQADIDTALGLGLYEIVVDAPVIPQTPPPQGAPQSPHAPTPNAIGPKGKAVING